MVQGSKRKVRCVETGMVFENIRKAAEYIKQPNCYSNITRCCKGTRNIAGGYHWEYVNEIDSLPGEEWLPAKHLTFNTNQYEIIDRYFVSNFGRIANDVGGIVESRDCKGYRLINLNGETYKIHRLVASTFIKNNNPLVNIVVNHIDEDKSNNHVDNLEWVTVKQNCNHGTAKKRAHATNKEKYGDNYLKRMADIAGNKRKKKVKCVETGVIYDSLQDAAEAVGLKRTNGSCISVVLDKPDRTAGGYHWKSVNTEED